MSCLAEIIVGVGMDLCGGDPGTARSIFCGEPTALGEKYCPYHRRTR